MKRSAIIISGSCAVVFQVALTAWFFCMSSINFRFDALGLDLLALCAVPLVLYYVNLFLLERSVSVPFYMSTQLLFLSIGIFVFLKTSTIEPFVTRTMVINGFVYAITFVVAAYTAWEGPGTAGLLMRFDILAVMIMLLLLLNQVRVLPAFGSTAAMCGSAAVLTLLAIISNRAGNIGKGAKVQGNSAVGKLLFGAAFVITLLTAAFAAVFVSGSFKNVSQFLVKIAAMILSGIKSVLLFMWRILERFLLWLSEIFAPETVSAPPEELMGIAMPELPPQPEAELPGNALVFVVIVAAALIAFVIFRLRHVHVGKLSRKAVIIETGERHGGVNPALLQLLAKLRGALMFSIDRLRFRKSPAALLILCEKRASAKLKRKTTESGSCYLRKLAVLCEDRELAKAVEKLAELVELSFYSPHGVRVDDALYKTIVMAKF